jgi:periplasmic divalent cation tolerance protein
MSEPLVVLITAGSQAEAERIATALVGERLAACANIVPGITSVYRWEGQVKSDREWLLLVKTELRALEGLERRVRTLHSYDVPEIIALPLVGGSEPYLEWLDESVAGHEVEM